METGLARDEPLVGGFAPSDSAGDETPRTRCVGARAARVPATARHSALTAALLQVSPVFRAPFVLSRARGPRCDLCAARGGHRTGAVTQQPFLGLWRVRRRHDVFSHVPRRRPSQRAAWRAAGPHTGAGRQAARALVLGRPPEPQVLAARARHRWHRHKLPLRVHFGGLPGHWPRARRAARLRPAHLAAAPGAARAAQHHQRPAPGDCDGVRHALRAPRGVRVRRSPTPARFPAQGLRRPPIPVLPAKRGGGDGDHWAGDDHHCKRVPRRALRVARPGAGQR